MKEQIDQTEELARDIYDSAFVSKAVSISLAIDLTNKGWKKQSEWISVTERMPPALGKVLVYSPILGVYMTCYTAYSPRFSEPSVTHWMPLPELPEKKGGAE